MTQGRDAAAGAGAGRAAAAGAGTATGAYSAAGVRRGGGAEKTEAGAKWRAGAALRNAPLERGRRGEAGAAGADMAVSVLPLLLLPDALAAAQRASALLCSDTAGATQLRPSGRARGRGRGRGDGCCCGARAPCCGGEGEGESESMAAAAAPRRRREDGGGRQEAGCWRAVLACGKQQIGARHDALHPGGGRVRLPRATFAPQSDRLSSIQICGCIQLAVFPRCLALSPPSLPSSTPAARCRTP
jgi:hypothetical protein